MYINRRHCCNLSLNSSIVNVFLEKHIQNKQKRNILLNILTDGKLSHSSPLDKKLLRSYGLNTKMIPYDLKNTMNELFEFI